MYMNRRMSLNIMIFHTMKYSIIKWRVSSTWISITDVAGTKEARHKKISHWINMCARISKQGTKHVRTVAHLWGGTDWLEGNVFKRDLGYMSVYQAVRIIKLIFVCFHVNIHFVLKFRTVLNTNITSEAISHIQWTENIKAHRTESIKPNTVEGLFCLRRLKISRAGVEL